MANRFPEPRANAQAWDFLTITVIEDIADVITFTAGPKRPPDHYYPWVSGVTLFLDTRGRVFGGVIAKSRLRALTITVPLRVLIDPDIMTPEQTGDDA